MVVFVLCNGVCEVCCEFMILVIFDVGVFKVGQVYVYGDVVIYGGLFWIA